MKTIGVALLALVALFALMEVTGALPAPEPSRRHFFGGSPYGFGGYGYRPHGFGFGYGGYGGGFGGFGGGFGGYGGGFFG
ncbi:neuropeptide-like protein 31 isoform X2 [Macrobrachium nipponense]|uniref:neuropeptide-like protein 31 isoform X1 n=1 Tax=Macrobrachium nipponense TaxID=159736 RepID=UPI0030C815FB